MRSERLWLPTGSSAFLNFGELSGPDSLAAPSASVLGIASMYSQMINNKQYTGDLLCPLVERSRWLSSETTASQIPSLILNDVLAKALAGTETLIRTKPAQYPAKLTVHDPVRGIARARAAACRYVIRYDLRYTVPAFIVLTPFAPLLLWAAGILAASPRTTLRYLNNQMSTGGLAMGLLCPGGAARNSRRMSGLRAVASSC